MQLKVLTFLYYDTDTDGKTVKIINKPQISISMSIIRLSRVKAVMQKQLLKRSKKITNPEETYYITY